MEAVNWTEVDRIVDLALKEDLGTGDVTSQSVLGAGQWGEGHIVAKAPCTVVGLFMVERIYARLDGRIRVASLVEEGQRVRAGTPLVRFDGPFRELLAGERTILNFLQRLCGTATLTARLVRAVRNTGAGIYDTRKTTPGLRTLEKYAVRAAGGFNHRMGLYDAVLIKENHVAAAGSIAAAIGRARERCPGLELEVEVTNLEELVLAVEYGADVVMLDNMSSKDILKAGSLVGDRVELEVSGGVKPSTVRGLAVPGIARISVGMLTHSAPAADLSMWIVPVEKVP